MLHLMKDLENLKIVNEREELGYLNDFLVDDTSWTTRYIVVDTGNWITGQKVLISPHSLKKQNFVDKLIYTGLTKQKIEDSPPISKDESVSRQHEINLFEYCGWPAYWNLGAQTQAILESKDNGIRKKNNGDQHLRSIREIRNYNVEAIDGEIGIVDDFIIDDKNWILKYLVVDTRKWLHWLPGGRNVLISPEWTKEIKWHESKINIDLDKYTIEQSPKFNSVEKIDSAFENRLYNCYKQFIQKKIVDVDN